LDALAFHPDVEQQQQPRHVCDESCWETWTETEDGRLISYTANTCEYSADPED
jgi:hypothetical protein